MRIWRITALVFTLILLLCAISAAALADDSAPTVRIYLKRLNLTDRADLTLAGQYSAVTAAGVEMLFEEDTALTLVVRGERIILFLDEVRLDCGSSVRFVQCENNSKDWEGIRFGRGNNVFPGELRFTVQGGQLMCVNTLSVEDYLCGVVPYEMSNSFPLEALKAQAVCARTYAVAHINSKKDYDMVDTTANQVYNGVSRSNTNAIRAVRETAGVVGTYKGQLAECFYAASNGGQTELVENVWSSAGDWGYYQIKDDPYDLENPESPMLRKSLSKNGASLPDTLVQLIRAEMQNTLRNGGYSLEPRDFAIEALTAAELGGNSGDRRNYSTLTLTFTWKGRRQILPEEPDEEITLFGTTPAPTATPAVTPTATPAPTVYLSAMMRGGESTVTIKITSSLLSSLGLSISGSGNELLTLTEKDNAFVLESRRYGHGVGMSQRGAQWMAGHYHKTYSEILSFYYPGMQLKKISSSSLPLPTVRADLASTPGPAATATPKPTLMPVSTPLPEGAYLASVENIAEDSSLNLREAPSTSAGILMRLYRHQQLAVLEKCEEDGWVHVKTDSIEGYVMVSFLTPVTGGAEE